MRVKYSLFFPLRRTSAVIDSESQEQDITVRRAAEADASAIVQIHYDAVHLTASKDYDDEILNDWSAQTANRVKELELQIASNPEDTDMFVAEIQGSVVGFGEIAANNNELRAVYVSPKAGRKGVGKALLNKIEETAIQKGLSELCLDSSLTAYDFYLANGFVKDEESYHSLRSGRQMKCVKMHKLLLNRT